MTRKGNNKKFKELMSNNNWRASLSKIDKNLKKLKEIKKEVKKIEISEKQLENFVPVSRKVNLINFDDKIQQQFLKNSQQLEKID